MEAALTWRRGSGDRLRRVTAALSGSWVIDVLIAPLVTGIGVGLALRVVGALAELREHDQEAVAIGIDLVRWVRDRDRELDGEIRTLVNTPGLLYTGALRSGMEGAMRRALHEYRDNTSGLVRRYCAMAQAETSFHRLVRHRQKRWPAEVTLSNWEHLLMLGWREREVPGDPERAKVEPGIDPTRSGDAFEVWAAESGLSWHEARKLYRTDGEAR